MGTHGTASVQTRKLQMSIKFLTTVKYTSSSSYNNMCSILDFTVITCPVHLGPWWLFYFEKILIFFLSVFYWKQMFYSFVHNLHWALELIILCESNIFNFWFFVIKTVVIAKDELGNL